MHIFYCKIQIYVQIQIYIKRYKLYKSYYFNQKFKMAELSHSDTQILPEGQPSFSGYPCLFLEDAYRNLHTFGRVNTLDPESSYGKVVPSPDATTPGDADLYVWHPLNFDKDIIREFLYLEPAKYTTMEDDDRNFISMYLAGTPDEDLETLLKKLLNVYKAGIQNMDVDAQEELEASIKNHVTNKMNGKK